MPPTFNGLQAIEKALGGLEWQCHVVIVYLPEGGGGEGDGATHVQQQHKGHPVEGAEHLTAHPVLLDVGHTYCAICWGWMLLKWSCKRTLFHPSTHTHTHNRRKKT